MQSGQTARYLRSEGKMPRQMKKWILFLLAVLVFLFASCSDKVNGQETDNPGKNIERTDETVRYDCDAVFFGDSITCDGNFDELFPEYRIVNLGVYGDTIEDLIRRVPDVRAENPKQIFLLVGINSLTPNNGEACLIQYAELLDALRAACPEAELIVQSVLPVGTELDWDGGLNKAVRSFNEGLKALAGERDCPFVDLYALYEQDGALNPTLTRDGVHLNFNAYGPWAAAIRPMIEKR